MIAPFKHRRLLACTAILVAVLAAVLIFAKRLPTDDSAAIAAVIQLGGQPSVSDRPVFRAYAWLNKLLPRSTRATLTEVSFKKSVAPEDLAVLKHCRDLRLLVLTDTDFTTAFAERCADLTQLTDVSIVHSTLAPGSIDVLASLPSLLSLRLTESELADAQCAALAHAPGLVRLSLGGTRSIDRLLETVPRIPGLRTLELNATSLKDAEFEALSACSKLEELDISDTLVTYAGIRSFVNQLPPRLKKLGLRGLVLSDATVTLLRSSHKGLTVVWTPHLARLVKDDSDELDFDKYVERAWSLYDYVETYQCSKDEANVLLRRADADFSTALGLQNEADIFIRRGRVRKLLGRNDEALQDFTEAVRLDPSSLEALGERGGFYLDRNQFMDAIADYQAALRIDPVNPIVLVNAGLAYRKAGQLEKAAEYFNRAVSASPTESAIYFQRGCLFQGRGKWDEAIADYTTAIELQPLGASYYEARSETYESKGDLKAAAADAARAKELRRKR